MRRYLERWKWTMLTAVALGGAAVVKHTAGWWTGWLPGCPIRQLAGWYCAGCGGTRALLALLGFDLGRAVRMNAAVVVLAAVALALWARALWREWRGRRPVLPVVAPGWVVLGALLLLAFGLLRNLAWWPFNWLAPG